MKSTTTSPPRSRQAELARDDFGGGEVGSQGGFLYVVAAAHFGGVDVNRHQRLGCVENHARAGGGGDFAGEDFLNLPLQCVVYDFALVQARASGLVGENQRHKGADLLVVGGVVADDLGDIGAVVVADGAQEDVVFAVDEDGSLLLFAGLGQGFPEFEQVVQVPAEFLGGAAEAGGAEDDGHSARGVEFAQALHHFVAGAAVALLGDLASAGLQGHQHEVASREGDVHGERGALFGDMVAADLHQHAVALFQRGGRGGGGGVRVGGGGLAVFGRGVLNEDAGDVLERKESVFFVAEVYKGGLQRGLYAGDDALVDVALAVFASGDLVVEVGEASVFGDDDAAFLRVLGADENSLHCCSFPVRVVVAGPCFFIFVAKRRAARPGRCRLFGSGADLAGAASFRRAAGTSVLFAFCGMAACVFSLLRPRVFRFSCFAQMGGG